VVEDGQWAWRTRFDHLGWHFVPTRDTDLIFQALDGYTLMEGYAGPLVEIDFWSAFLLASRAWGPHRASLRFDAFGATDRDGLADDPNQEHGHAWTAAYFYTLELRSTEARGGWRFGVELLSVDSDRPARRLFGEPAAQRETTAQLVVQWRWR
jgi:hypothetical protein